MIGPLLSLREACSHITESRLAGLGTDSEVCAGPVLQYWDRRAPAQVKKLLNWNKKYCKKHGIGYALYNDRGAKKLLSKLDDKFLRAYLLSPHPAVKSDLFRLCYISIYGGYYLDGDMAVRKNFPSIFHMANKNGLLLQWNSHDRTNCPNWLFGFPRDSALCRVLAERTAESILATEASDGPDAILRNVLEISGPGLFTRIIGTFLASHPTAQHPAIITVADGYDHVQNGPEFLGRSLEYKSTERHWLVAAARMAP